MIKIKKYNNFQNWKQDQQATHVRLKEQCENYKTGTAIFQDRPEILDSTGEFLIIIDNRIIEYCSDIITDNENIDESEIYKPIYDFEIINEPQPAAVPVYVVKCNISDVNVNGIDYTRKVQMLDIDIKQNQLKTTARIFHYLNDELIEKFNSNITLIASNEEVIQGIPDFTFVIGLHENDGMKISQIFTQIISLRDMDGTINKKYLHFLERMF